MKSVLISTQPKWCEKICNKIGEIADGTPIYEKRVEVRKTRPKIDTPFKAYIYCTKGQYEALWRYRGEYYYDTQFPNERPNKANGKVIGEFICDEITKCCSEFYPVEEQPVFEALYRLSEEDEHQSILDCIASNDADTVSKFLKETCLTLEDFREYLGNGENEFYAWHISNLVIYDKPKELSEFYTVDNEAVKQCEHRERIYNNPDFTNNALLPGSYVCNKGELDWCTKCKTKPLTRPPQSWCYVEALSV